jgi:hypothetical protein
MERGEEMRTLICALAATVIIWAGSSMYSAANTNQSAKTQGNPAGKYFMTCPNGVKVGIKGASEGWYADPDQYHSFIEATVVRQGNTSFITCDYGTSGMKKYALSRIAAGYDCRAVAVGSRDVVCTPKPKAPIKIR